MAQLFFRSVLSLAMAFTRLVLPPCALSIVPKRSMVTGAAGILTGLPLSSIAVVPAATARSGISPDATQLVLKVDALSDNLLLSPNCLVYLPNRLKRL